MWRCLSHLSRIRRAQAPPPIRQEIGRAPSRADRARRPPPPPPPLGGAVTRPDVRARPPTHRRAIARCASGAAAVELRRCVLDMRHGRHVPAPPTQPREGGHDERRCVRLGPRLGRGRRALHAAAATSTAGADHRPAGVVGRGRGHASRTLRARVTPLVRDSAPRARAVKVLAELGRALHLSRHDSTAGTLAPS